jgi:hypothetical protein
MAGDKGSRRFVRLWWVLAFTIGAVAGAASITLAGLQYTAWWIVGVCGTLMVVTAIFERYGDSKPILPRSARRRWHPPLQRHPPPAGRTTAKPKDPVRRGRLRAINGKKVAEPPSGGGVP